MDIRAVTEMRVGGFAGSPELSMSDRVFVGGCR